MPTSRAYTEEVTSAINIGFRCATTELQNGHSPAEWVLIHGGTFDMGSISNQNSLPIHTVSVPDFFIMKTEVTVNMFFMCVDSGNCNGSFSDPGLCSWYSVDRRMPINCVTYEQANNYCAFVGGRLPSESEWEYASTSGGQYEFPWGSNALSCELAIFNEDGLGEGCGTGYFMTTCSRESGISPDGLCDMIGNLSEWVEDCYHRDYSGAPVNGSAWTENCLEQ
jgi:formylglycine-generating enzyme required for sulfatase activity